MPLFSMGLEKNLGGPLVQPPSAMYSTWQGSDIIAFMLDPLKAGLVTSLGRPGGNLTGITLDAGIEIWGKRLEMLKEAIPSTANAAFLGMREGWEGSSGQALRDAGGRLGISLVFMFP